MVGTIEPFWNSNAVTLGGFSSTFPADPKAFADALARHGAGGSGPAPALQHALYNPGAQPGADLLKPVADTGPAIPKPAAAPESAKPETGQPSAPEHIQASTPAGMNGNAANDSKPVSQQAQRDRFVDSVISLSSFDKVMWSPPALDPSGPDRRTFSDWLNSNDPLPQTGDETRQFLSFTDMNCYQWMIFAALRSGAADRATARAYAAGIQSAPGSDLAAKLNAVYGTNQTRPIDVKYRQVDGQWRVERIDGQELAQKGDILSFNGKDHIMTVTGRDTQGRLLVASFPTVIYGGVTDGRPSYANPYVGTFEGFLQTNLDAFNWSGEGNNFDGDQIRVGAPGFIKPH